jgi:hypothetical protein
MSDTQELYTIDGITQRNKILALSKTDFISGPKKQEESVESVENNISIESNESNEPNTTVSNYNESQYNESNSSKLDNLSNDENNKDIENTEYNNTTSKNTEIEYDENNENNENNDNDDNDEDIDKKTSNNTKSNNTEIEYDENNENNENEEDIENTTSKNTEIEYDENDNNNDTGENENVDENNNLETISNTKNVSNEEDEDEENEILEGGFDIEYTIDYLLPNDEKLINPENVYKKVEEYIKNFKNPVIEEYKKAFRNLYQRYSNNKYIIKTVAENDETTRIIVMKNDKKQDIVLEITKPKYNYYNKDNNLIKLEKQISNDRKELEYIYEDLTSKINILPEDKKRFEKIRKSFIELLEEYYTYKLYHKKINKIVSNNKSKIFLQDLTSFYKIDTEENPMILSGKFYNIDNDTINSLNILNSDKFTEYNNLIIKLNGKSSDKIKNDKKIMEEIKQYLDKKDINKINKLIIKQSANQSEYIDYIITSLPIA